MFVLPVYLSVTVGQLVISVPLCVFQPESKKTWNILISIISEIITLNCFSTYLDVLTLKIKSKIADAAFLCEIVKVRATTVSCFRSVRRSAWSNSAPTGRICIKFDI
jgi:hypothetical protein